MPKLKHTHTHKHFMHFNLESNLKPQIYGIIRCSAFHRYDSTSVK